MDDTIRTDQRTFILNFHGLGEPKIPLLPGDENYWLEPGFFAEILDAVRERKNIQITFDDSNESDYAIALPLLKARKMTARFFVLAAPIGQDGYLSARQIQSLCAEGMIIGNHGMYHRRWATLGEAEIHEELAQAKERLQQITGTPIVEAACPFGSYNRRILHRLRQNGYQKVYTSDGGPASAKDWLQPRNTVLRSYNLDQVLTSVADSRGLSQDLWRGFKLTLKRWR